jgi:hypothetical protein
MYDHDAFVQLEMSCTQAWNVCTHAWICSHKRCVVIKRFSPEIVVMNSWCSGLLTSLNTVLGEIERLEKSLEKKMGWP